MSTIITFTGITVGISLAVATIARITTRLMHW